jgi:hypothetical protein
MMLTTAADAQVTQYRVVAPCGAQTYAAGQNAPVTQDTLGNICVIGGSSSDPQYIVSAPLTAISGTQTNVSISSATGLTVPSGATTAVVSVLGTNNSSNVCAYWRDDGTSATSVAGTPVSTLASMFYKVTNLPLTVIQASGATCTMNVAYYKP